MDYPETDYYRPAMDLLNIALGAMSLRSSLLSRLDCSGRWSLTSEDGGGITAYCVLDGRCWFIPDDGLAERLDQGDILLMPGWLDHRLCSAPEMPPSPIRQIAGAAGIQLWDPRHPFGEVLVIPHHPDGPGQRKTQLLTMMFRATDEDQRTLAACLPPVQRFPADDPGLQMLLASVVSFMSDQSGNHGPGFGVAAHKLAEFLFVQLVRRVPDVQPDGVRGWLRGLQSPALSRVLAAMHAAPERKWSNAELARVGNMSRSTFCAEFRRVMEDTPMAYLRRLRLDRAMAILRAGGSIKQAGTATGYATAYAFHKAFRTVHGMTPGQWRKKLSPPHVGIRAGL